MTQRLSDREQLEQKMSGYSPSAAERAFHSKVGKRFENDPEAADRLFGGGYQPGQESSAGVSIQVIDEMISIIKLDHIDVDLWMEDDQDVIMHILPANGEALFEPWEVARKQIDKVMARVFDSVPGIRAMGNYYGWRSGDHSVSRKSNPKDRGRDIFEIRIVNLWTRPHADKFAVDALKLYNDVLAGRSPLVHA